MKPLKVLMTSGATREAIDRVRFLSNFSTGKTGSVLADHFLNAGFEVLFLRGKDSFLPTQALHPHLTIQPFSDFASLNTLLEENLRAKSFDAVVHLAAVSDFSVSSIQVGREKIQPRLAEKIDSLEREMVVTLKKNFKIVDFIKSYSKNSKMKLVAFKLTCTQNTSEQLKAVQKVAIQSGADFVVHNDLLQIENPIGGTERRHEFSIFDGRDVIRGCHTREDLAKALVQLLKQECVSHPALTSVEAERRL